MNISILPCIFALLFGVVEFTIWVVPLISPKFHPIPNNESAIESAIMECSGADEYF